MDLYSLISKGLDENLKCTSCQNYLSHFPISLCSNNSNICGRCPPPNELTFRNKPFETVCQFLKFPCRYRKEGCLKELQPREVPQHEQTCPFKVVPCFITKPNVCKWKGSVPTVLQHCRSEHCDLILETGDFQVDLKVSEDLESFLEFNETLYIFMRKFDSKSQILTCALYPNQYQNIESHSVSVSFKHDNKTLSIEFATCKFDQVVPSQLSLQSFTNAAVLKGRIAPTPNKESDCPELTEINKVLLSALRCSKCPNFALPPINRRSKDFDIACRFCRSHFVSTCNKCYQVSQKTDDILNLITNVVNYPCIYQRNGCKYFGKHSRILKHQTVCEFVNTKCVFDELCAWEGAKKFLNEHILEKHQEQVVDLTEELEVSSRDPVKYKVIKFWNRLFRLGYFVDANKVYRWSVQVIGDYTEGFKYEVDISDGTESGLRILVRKFCSLLSEKDKIFSELCDGCYFERKQVAFLDASKSQGEDVVRFRVRIFK